MNLCELRAHVMRRDSTRMAAIFNELKEDSQFKQFDIYEMNDFLFRELVWAPEEVSVDSRELYQINIRTIPMVRYGNGNLCILSEDAQTFWPSLNDITNPHTPIHDMVHAALVNHVTGWDLRIDAPAMRMPVPFTYDQLRQNFDGIVVGAEKVMYLDTELKVAKLTKHLTITVVLLITPNVLYALGNQKYGGERTGFYTCDNSLKTEVEDSELPFDQNESFYAHLTKNSFDATVMLLPGLE